MPTTGFLDLDAKKANVLSYEPSSGRKAYQVIAGDSWEQLAYEYTSLTGRQPLPPRWAFGNFASRFGYHTEAEARATVDKFIAEKVPLDAIVFDLYWFGPDMRGSMGNFTFNKEQFPQSAPDDGRLRRQGRQDHPDHRAVRADRVEALAGSGRTQGAGDRRQGRAVHLRLLLREHGPDRHHQPSRAQLVLGHLQGTGAAGRGRLVGRPGRAGSPSGRHAPRRRQRGAGAQHLRPRVGAAYPRRLPQGFPAAAAVHPDALRLLGLAALRA